MPNPQCRRVNNPPTSPSHLQTIAIILNFSTLLKQQPYKKPAANVNGLKKMFTFA